VQLAPADSHKEVVNVGLCAENLKTFANRTDSGQLVRLPQSRIKEIDKLSILVWGALLKHLEMVL
jgi:hypothetical protein